MNFTPISNFPLSPLLFLTSCISGFAFFLFDKCVWCRRHAVVLLQGSDSLFTIENRLSRLTSCFPRRSGTMLVSTLAVTVCQRVIDDGSDDG